MHPKFLVIDCIARRCLLFVVGMGLAAFSVAADDDDVGSGRVAFAQLGQELPDANSYRTASGAPGHGYWQQQADYDIAAKLNAPARQITASAVVGYTNNSPDEMDFLWLNMDQNIFKEDSKGGAIVPLKGSRNGSRGQKLDGGFKISAVQVISGKGRDRSIISADYEIYDTRMKVILPSPLKAAGGKVSVKIDFSHGIHLPSSRLI